MECYLCKHCKAVTNIPITGSCEESATEEHEWVSGNKVEDQVQMLWEREPDSLTSAANWRARRPAATSDRLNP